MRLLAHRPYGDAMNNSRRDSIIRHPSVPISAAAELTDVDVPTVRDWARRGSLVIEQRGDMEVVQLEAVTALASRRRASRNRGLRDRLRQEDGTVAVLAELVNIADLQELARQQRED
jgi:phage terminase Nu1 subunit (DNA packaging protein)